MKTLIGTANLYAYRQKHHTVILAHRGGTSVIKLSSRSLGVVDTGEEQEAGKGAEKMACTNIGKLRWENLHQPAIWTKFII